MRLSTLATFAALLLLTVGARDAAAQAGCGAGNSGSCLQVHGAPGCNDAECCATVCVLYPPCCSAAWDSTCVGIANDSCIGLCGAAVNRPCESVHDNAGCSNAECCAAVCMIRPDCCNFSWDLVCVIIASSTCEPPPPQQCGLAGQGACTQPHPSPGCSDASCCETVCQFRDACCTFAWDEVCVSLANSYCGGCALECPATAFPEAETCGARSNQPCAAGQVAMPLAEGATVCGTVDGSGTATTWAGDRDGYAITLADPDGDGRVRLTLNFAANFAAFVAVHPAGCPLGGAVANVGSSACLPGSSSTCLAPGSYVVLVAPGAFPTAASSSTYSCEFPLRYTLSYAASQDGCEPPCTVSTGPCFDAHPGVGCETPACCEATCATDPLCCTEIWDVSCAREAAAACGVPVPANDPCAGALPIGPGTTIDFSTIRATVSSPALPASCNAGQGALIGPDVWFRYTGERSGSVSVATCGSLTDMRLAVYSGDCTGLTLVGCSSTSQTCSPNTGARVQFQAQCGTSYLIRVGGEIPSMAGSASISLTALGPVCPQFCPADLNRDGIVSGSDLGLLLGNWGLVGVGDLDVDGTIGGSDLGLLLGAWGPCPVPPP